MNLESVNQAATNHTLGANFSAPTYYDVLNVDKTATRFAIRESYLRLKSLYTTGGDALYGVAAAEDLNRHLQDLERAFQVLNDDTRRAAYDREQASNHLGAGAHDASSSVNQGWAPDATLGAVAAEIVQTSRSMLKVTRIQATGARDESLQSNMMSIIADADIGDGSTLVALREAAGVSQTEIQERTKISLEYVRSIEANLFDRLPRVVYVKGFLRSYLRYLNAPKADAIVTAYVARLEAYQAGQK